VYAISEAKFAGDRGKHAPRTGVKPWWCHCNDMDIWWRAESIEVKMPRDTAMPRSL